MLTETGSHTHTHRCWWNPDEARWVCGAPAEELVDTRDMLVVHGALLRELRLTAGSVRRTPPGDRAHATTVDRHLVMLCDLLHHHHAGEDALLWPLLRKRVSGANRAHLDVAEAQHTSIGQALERVAALRPRWTATAGAVERDQLAEAVGDLHASLAEHLDHEERTLLPLAAITLTTEEWAALGESGMAATPKPLLPLTFGLFAYEGDPEVLRSMLAKAPLVPRLLLPRIAPRLYARRARAVHGTSRP